MTKRKRKSPDKKRSVTGRVLTLAVAGGAALWQLAGRHPRLVGGVSTFAVLFATVAANAIWYQPGQHPSPFLRTRSASDFTSLLGAPRSTLLADRDQSDVTTFRVEREGEGEAAPPPFTADSAAITSVQRALTARGLYEGAADGVIGPRTEAAISRFQTSVGMQADGQVTEALVAMLAAQDPGFTAAVPAQRPQDLSVLETAVDPVAAAIRSASAAIVTEKPAQQAQKPATPARYQPAKPQAAKPQAAAQQASAPRPQRQVQPAGPVPPRAVAPSPPQAATAQAATPASYDPGLVMDIQRGLTNMAYRDVVIDGMPGESTREAIRRFERHYQMPVTGEPSAAVLKKLRAIGAL